MVQSGLVIPTLLMIVALSWLYAIRPDGGTALRRPFTLISSVPAPVWILLGAIAFVLPVLEYWITARSHGNALAGFLPWADATEYYQCSEVFLLGLDGPAHCGKRPYYFAFFADLLWLTGNRLQLALLFQAVIIGLAAIALTSHVLRTMGVAAALGSYAVLYAFAAALCSGLVMTENAGFALGTLGILLLLRSTETPTSLLFLCGITLLAAAMSARPGPLFVLPALGIWYLFYGNGTFGRRFFVASAAGIAAALAMAFVTSPILVAGGTWGSTHSNFSYSLYGLVVGGKGWLQVTVDHPEIFIGDGVSQTDKVYALALESLRERPQLALFGYFKGIAKYFNDLFRYTTEFKPLRFLLLLLPWILGVVYTLKNWRKRRESLFLFVLAGILISSPFLIYDGHNRAFASVAPVDALFVAMGIRWLADRLSETEESATLRPPALTQPTLAGGALAALALPVLMLATIRTAAPATTIAAPQCKEKETAVAVRPGKGSPVLRLVANDVQTSLFPLRIRADDFARRMHRSVHKKRELTLPPGSNLVWGIRLDDNASGKRVYFNWPGELPKTGQVAGFCVGFTPRAHVGTATRMQILGSNN